ncbi:MAG: hypothetical protein RR501_12450, partial [Cloacibacillus sp.]
MSIKKVKEKMGLLYGFFAPIVSEPDDAIPVYGNKTDMGAMKKAYLTTTTTNAPLYGDDSQQLIVDKFVSGELDMENLLSSFELEAAFYGSTLLNGVITDNDNDEPVPGCFGYIQKLMGDDKITYYRAVFLYKTQAHMNQDNSDTKETSISFSNNSV